MAIAHRIAVALSAMLLSASTAALMLENLNIDLSASQPITFVPLTNRNATTSIYTVSMLQVTIPREEGKETLITDGSLLYSPQKLVLAPGEQAGFKFYYRGPQDNRERYYRVKFTETPVAGIRQPSLSGLSSSDFRIAVSAIMIVRPAQQHFNYEIIHGRLKNSGNTYFKYLSSIGCSNRYLQAIFIPPGESHIFYEKEQSSKKIIVLGKKIIKLSNCS